MWKYEDFAEHQYGDVQRHNDNVSAGRTLCSRCEGTGNELYSMWKKCTDCAGLGYIKEPAAQPTTPPAVPPGTAAGVA